MIDEQVGPLEIHLKKQPHAQQQVAIDCDEGEQLYGGAKRGGKSVWLCQKSVLLNVMFPGNRGMMCRLNFTDLQDSTLEEFFKTCPEELILNHHKGERTIVLRTIDDRSLLKAKTKDGYSLYASRQLYRGTGDPDEFEKIKGIALGHLELDEPSEIPFQQFLMLRGQMDYRLPDGTCPPYMVLLASNPEPGWVEDRFIDHISRPGQSFDGKIFIPALPSDNPFLPPGYVEELSKSAPKEWVLKYIRGLWGASEGAIFKEFDEILHNLDNWINPNVDKDYYGWAWGMNLVLAIDHADTGIVAMVLCGVDRAGNIYALQEYYGNNKLVSEHCFEMREKIFPFLSMNVGSGGSMVKKVDYMLIDPSTTQKTQQRGGQLQGIVDDYRTSGFPCIPAWNALEHGFSLIAEHLHPIPIHRHPITGLMGAPSIFISKTRCPQLWKQVRGIKRVVKPNGVVEFKGIDHALDCLRYIVNSRPRRPELAKIDEGNLSSADLMMRRAHEKWARNFAKVTASGTAFAGMGLT